MQKKLSTNPKNFVDKSKKIVDKSKKKIVDKSKKKIVDKSKIFCRKSKKFGDESKKTVDRSKKFCGQIKKNEDKCKKFCQQMKKKIIFFPKIQNVIFWKIQKSPQKSGHFDTSGSRVALFVAEI